jgi:hypothetical protein
MEQQIRAVHVREAPLLVQDLFASEEILNVVPQWKRQPIELPVELLRPTLHLLPQWPP